MWETQRSLGELRAGAGMVECCWRTLKSLAGNNFIFILGLGVRAGQRGEGEAEQF